MNLYFILEGEKTEVLLYPQWISYILPELGKVEFESDVKNNNYYIFSGGGIPSIYNHTVNAIKNINDNPIFDRLIICLDGEEIGAANRVKEIDEYLIKSGIKLTSNCKLDYVIQNVCIETWFLGNRRIVKKNPEGLLLKEYIKHFNVTIEDPEDMDKIEGYRNKAHFHYSYFREVLKEHNLTYRKSRPKIVMEQTFFKELGKRVDETTHIGSFKQLLNLLEEIKVSIANK